LLIVRALNLDAPTPRPFVLRYRHRDFEHAILERGFCVFRVCPSGQRDTAIKSAVASLAHPIAFLGLFMFLAPLALNRQSIIGELDFDVLFLEARQIKADDELIITLEDLNLG